MTTVFGNRSLGRDTFAGDEGGFLWRGPGYDDGWTEAKPVEVAAVRDELDAWLATHGQARIAAPRIEPEPGEAQPANSGYGRCIWCRRVYTLRSWVVPNHRWAGIRSAPTCPGSRKPPVPRQAADDIPPGAGVTISRNTAQAAVRALRNTAREQPLDQGDADALEEIAARIERRIET